ncbi:MAG TPA: DUF6559 family protein [Polyangiaceae bacterium]|nr:DUF6559 family protein [Polyangiaceae bacterium]
MFERIQKWLALRSYRANLGHLLVDRYGRERRYTPPQVLTTIKQHRLSERYAAYACAMFCSKRAYDDFVASRLARTDIPITPLAETSTPLWFDIPAYDWPAHHELTTEIHHYGFSHNADFGPHYSDHSSGDFGDAYHHGGGDSHHGGGHDGGGHHGGGHDGFSH